MKITQHLCDDCKSFKSHDQLIEIDGIELCRACAIKLYTNSIVVSCDGSLDDFGVQINLLKSYEVMMGTHKAIQKD